MAHFNAANVWGRVSGYWHKKSRTGKPYLRLELNCYGTYGTVKIYGQLWGEANITALGEAIKKSPGAIIRCRGFFSQHYQGKEHPNFVFYEWRFGSHKDEPRAAFVLRGDCVLAGFDEALGNHVIELTVKDENFRLIADATQLVKIDQGALIETKGYLRQGSGEDEFGVAAGPVRPWCKKITLIGG
ncbi:MAG: hypothetical protein GY874_14240 [Desulfobacteraceae bacterium]|nr:hypothetical protein [Desulfobacteraceae bacterium]